MTKGMNNADKTLLLAAALFLFFLALHIEFKDNLLADGLLFVAEAALVGGIADWFAVTAIFRKPLGFPYHTALLPRRRAEFIEATTTMLEQEFFSERKLITHLKQFEIFSFILNFFKSKELKIEITEKILSEVENLKINEKKYAISYLRENFYNIILKILDELKNSGKDRLLIKEIALYAKSKVMEEKTRQIIYEAFVKYEEEKLKEVSAFFLNMIAKAIDAVNFDEASEIFQNKLASFFEEFASNEALQDTVLSLMRERLYKYLTAKDYATNREELRNEIFSALNIESALEEIIEKVTYENADDFVSEEYGRLLTLIESDAHLYGILEHLIYDVMARSALYAHTKVADVVNDAISALTDDELNKMVYEKVESDLIWIRMNGSIVGSIVGATIFIIGLAFK
ncbi:MAG: DUF445 domain-containing protein [Selenomonadaceae bacterium]|nr:DUF445 domain-containing protein [Selenomonadaceae bacterium]